MVTGFGGYTIGKSWAQLAHGQIPYCPRLEKVQHDVSKILGKAVELQGQITSFLETSAYLPLGPVFMFLTQEFELPRTGPRRADAPRQDEESCQVEKAQQAHMKLLNRHISLPYCGLSRKPGI